MNKTKLRVFRPDLSTNCPLPLAEATVPAGFPSPADDYIESSLDLNRHLIKHPAATFFVRVSGQSMKNAGIHHDDILIVDRALEPRDGRVVIAVLDGELVVKRLKRHKSRWVLMPENDGYEAIEPVPESSFEIWGVVTYVIHSL